MKRVVACIAATLSAAVALALLPAGTASARVEPLGHWASSATVIQVYAPNLDPQWKVWRAIADWDKAGVLDIQRALEPCANCVVVEEVAHYPAVDGRPWRGLAYLDVSGSENVIDGCTIHLSSETRPRFRKSVLAHELGHCLGVPHLNIFNSLMHSTTQRPTRHDYRYLTKLYAGL